MVCLGVLFGVTRHHWGAAMGCSRWLVIWPMTLASFHGLFLIFVIAYLALAFLNNYSLIRFWKRVLEFIFIVIFFNFYVAWMIWGNVVAYRLARDCKYVDGANVVHRLVLAFVVLGYIAFAIWTLLACGTMLGLVANMLGKMVR